MGPNQLILKAMGPNQLTLKAMGPNQLILKAMGPNQLTLKARGPLNQEARGPNNNFKATESKLQFKGRGAQNHNFKAMGPKTIFSRPLSQKTTI